MHSRALLILSVGIVACGAQVNPEVVKPPIEPIAVPTTPKIKVNVVVAGCHASGTAAALRLAHLGHHVTLLCNESHAGGMLTVGQIGFVDGSPNVYWPERPNAPLHQKNGDVLPQSSWSLSGGMWKELRDRIMLESANQDIFATNRNEPRLVLSVLNKWIESYQNIKVFSNVKLITTTSNSLNGKLQISSISFKDSNQNVRNISGDYYIDGSDTGELVGLLKLPYRTGLNDEDGYQTTDKSRYAVMDYAYRATWISNSTGFYPSGPPKYYSVFLGNYRAATRERWNTYVKAFNINPGDEAYVHPVRIFNNQGRLNGREQDEIIDNNIGLPLHNKDQLWDINGAMNNLSGILLARALRTNSSVSKMFEDKGIVNPYGPLDSDVYYQWCNISWINDKSGLSEEDKYFLVQSIKDAAKSISLGFLWYVRSGDMQNLIRTIPGATNIKVVNQWSISNQVNTADGLPELMYEREGRRIESEYISSDKYLDSNGWMSIYSISPSYDIDKHRPDKISQSSPFNFPDSIVISDYPVDIHGTAGLPPENFSLPRAHQIPLRSAIPKNTVGLLVGSALGADRRAYASIRLDPVRFMTGGALADAIDLNAQKRLIDFTLTDYGALREILASQNQNTRYSFEAHNWDKLANSWSQLELGKAMQRLHVKGWLREDWIGTNEGFQYLSTPLPSNILTGSNGKLIFDYLTARSAIDAKSIPWPIDGSNSTIIASKLTGNPQDTRVARVADAYIWLDKQSK